MVLSFSSLDPPSQSGVNLYADEGGRQGEEEEKKKKLHPSTLRGKPREGPG